MNNVCLSSPAASSGLWMVVHGYGVFTLQAVNRDSNAALRLRGFGGSQPPFLPKLFIRGAVQTDQPAVFIQQARAHLHCVFSWQTRDQQDR